MRILITRDAQEAAPYTDFIRARGGAPLLYPLFTIVERDIDVPAFKSLAFTSRHAIRRLATLIDERTAPVFVVGPQSGDEARAQGFTDVRVAAGTGADLARLIGPADGPVFYARGLDIAYPLTRVLREKGISVTEKIVYEARALRTFAPIPDADMVLFFSARGAEIFTDSVQKQGLSERFVRSKALCLGAGMVESLSALPWGEIAVAATPDREGLCALIEEKMK